jgi:hypothetical protein
MYFMVRFTENEMSSSIYIYASFPGWTDKEMQKIMMGTTVPAATFGSSLASWSTGHHRVQLITEGDI